MTEKERRELAKQLRAVTGASARLCEKALSSHGDDMDRAADWLLSQASVRLDAPKLAERHARWIGMTARRVCSRGNAL